MAWRRARALRALTEFVPGFGQVHFDPNNEDDEVRFPLLPEDRFAELIEREAIADDYEQHVSSGSAAKSVRPTTDKPQLDHDGDGKAGGSKPKAKRAAKPAKAEKPASPLAAARKAYHAKFGKNPGPRWSVEQIEAKLAEDDLAQVLGEDGEPLEIPEGDLAHDLANPSSIGTAADDAPPTSE